MNPTLRKGLADISEQAKTLAADMRAFNDEHVSAMKTPSFDLVDHLRQQRSFSEYTFGPGERTQGVVDHIRKELDEVLESRGQLEEWIDVVILAFDGAWRSGYSPVEIVRALVSKQIKNQGRKWPDWRLAEPGKAIEHIRTEEPQS